jgi:hypothetical protein
MQNEMKRAVDFEAVLEEHEGLLPDPVPYALTGERDPERARNIMRTQLRLLGLTLSTDGMRVVPVEESD